MKDFFVSYTAVDKHWAEWIAYVLEEAGYSVTIQEWDFRPGGNFAVLMDQGLKQCRRVVAVLSPAYLTKPFPVAEWSAAFAADPTGTGNRLVPIMVEQCEPQGLLGQVISIGIHGRDEESARAEILRGITGKRAKPSAPPLFPGRLTAAPARPAPAEFPGASDPADAVSATAPVLESRRDGGLPAMRLPVHGEGTSNAAPSGVPSPSGDHGSALLGIIWEQFTTRREWPVFIDVDRQLHRRGYDFDTAMSELPVDLVRGVNTRFRMLPDDGQRLTLTIGGIANCMGGGEYVRVFLELVRFAVTLEINWTYVPHQRPSFTVADVEGHVALPMGTPGKTLMRQVLTVVDAEPWSAGFGGDGDERVYQVGRGIRQFAKARTIHEYWAIRQRLVHPDGSGFQPPQAYVHH